MSSVYLRNISIDFYFSIIHNRQEYKNKLSLHQQMNRKKDLYVTYTQCSVIWYFKISNAVLARTQDKGVTSLGATCSSVATLNHIFKKYNKEILPFAVTLEEIS